MRNIILFIQRYYVFFSFLLLEIIAIGSYINFNYYQRVRYFSSANAVTGSFFSTVHDVKSYFGLKEVNQRLAEENALLRQQLAYSYYNDSLQSDTISSQIDSTKKQMFLYTVAEVINNSVNKKNNYITLDRGYKHGIITGMGVICDQGVVGVIVDVSENFSTVLSVLSIKTKITPKIEGNEYFGSFEWDGFTPDMAKLTQVNMHAPIKNGMKVVTSGFSPIYPENINIGTIEEFSREADDNFYDIKIKLSTNFSSLTKVYVVKNLYKEEIDSLERITSGTTDN